MLSELESKGITGIAAECLLREGASMRHESRVVDAKDAAKKAVKLWVYEKDDNAPEEDDRYLMKEEGAVCMFQVYAAQAAGLCLLDQVGVGGTDGVSGEGTTRISCFVSLGKGRKQAHDGGAWNAAIEGAQRELAEEAGFSGRIITICPILPEDGLWGNDGKSWGRKEGGIGVILVGHEPWSDGRPDFTAIPVPPIALVEGSTHYDYSWHWSLARECLRRVAGTKPWHPDVYMDILGTAAEWAAVVNELDRITKIQNMERLLIAYTLDHPQEERLFEGGQIIAKLVCELSKLAEGFDVRGYDYRNGEALVPTVTIAYPKKENGDWWELR